MKTLLRIFLSILLIITLLAHSGCKKDEPAKPVTDRQMELLNGSWKAMEVKADNVLQDEYDDFILAFSANAGSTSLPYVTTARPFVSPWPESGVFSFDSTDPQHVLHRDDDVVVAYSVTGTTLAMSFTFSGEGYVNSRTTGMNGEWDFKFEKQ